jgi:hypothetical protein
MPGELMHGSDSAHDICKDNDDDEATSAQTRSHEMLIVCMLAHRLPKANLKRARKTQLKALTTTFYKVNPS